MLPNPEVREIALQDYLKIIQKRLGIIVVFLIIIPVTVAISLFNTTPVYRATVSILIERTLPKVTKFEEVSQTPYYATMEYYQTQYKILASRVLAEHVFDELRLSKDPDFRDLKDPVGKLHSQIKVEPVRSSQIVLVHIEDTDALRSASIANALAKAYIQQDIELRNRAAKEAAVWLESQLTGIRNKMQEAEEALNTYVQNNKIVTLPDIERKTQTLLEILKQNKAKIETDISEASKRYKAKHPKMIALKAQLEEINKKTEEETNAVLTLNQKLVQYNVLKKEVESTQQVYTAILSRAKETDVTEKLQISSIRILDSAKPPGSPFKPKKSRGIVMSIFISLFCGVGLSFFLEYLDASIRTAEDVSLYLNLPFLGYLPCADKEIKTEQEKKLNLLPKTQIYSFRILSGNTYLYSFCFSRRQAFKKHSCYFSRSSGRQNIFSHKYSYNIFSDKRTHNFTRCRYAQTQNT